MLSQPALFQDDANGAVIEGPYRYTLWRSWADDATLCGWVMLNPSTADDTEDDATIRRCIGYAKAWGYGGIVVRNLFALRATQPRGLLGVADPVGPDNDGWLTRWDGVERVVVAWGTGRWPHLHDRCQQVASLLEPLNPVCLRTAADGQPVHPLYQPANLAPHRWIFPKEEAS